MLLKYIFLWTFFGVNIAFAQMPNLKNNRAGAPSNTEMTQQIKAPVSDDIEEFDEGNLLLAYGDVKNSTTVGGQNICFISVKIQNKTIYPLEKLQVEFAWPLWVKSVSFSNFAIDEKNSISYRIAGQPCLRFDEKPRIKVTNCVLADKSISECGKMIKLESYSKF